MNGIRITAVVLVMLAFVNASTWAGNCLQKKSACCCVCQQKTCKLNVDVEEVSETGFDVKCEDICIPPVRFWWQECTPKRCPKVRTIRKLVEDKQTKKVCVYDWEVVTVCRGCYHRIHRLRCLELGLNENATPEQVGLSVPVPLPYDATEPADELVAVSIADVSSIGITVGKVSKTQAKGMIDTDEEDAAWSIPIEAPVQVSAFPSEIHETTR